MNQVTIGIPLYNEEKYIEAAIRSAVYQCFKLIISDNCSTDNSENICRQLSKEFPNIIYVRQTTNLGAVGNFKYLLDRADTNYFMWLGAHDVIPYGYVNKLLMALKSEKDAVLAYGNALHIDTNSRPILLYEYTYANKLISSDPKNRLLAIIRHLSDCSMIHGLFTTKNLKGNWRDINFLGGDHVLLAQIALSGKMILNPSTQLHRRDAHTKDDLQKQLIRIRGMQSARYKNSRKKEMQIALACLAKENSDGIFNLYRFKCYFFLISRFGNFSPSKIVSLVEYLVWNASRALRLIKHFLKS